MLEAAGVQLLSAGIDEAPVAYKNIHDVMAAQSDLVEVIARFDPKIVKMAEAGEKPEDCIQKSEGLCITEHILIRPIVQEFFRCAAMTSSFFNESHNIKSYLVFNLNLLIILNLYFCINDT